MNKFFDWVDQNQDKKLPKLIYQLFPLFICIFLYIFAITSSRFFITDLINPSPLVENKILLTFHFQDFIFGFFLYFVTAIDYALVVGRMQVTNPGMKSRVVMNILTVIGGYVGVTLVLFLYGFAKDINWLIIPILIFAGSVMIKLAFEGTEYFEKSKIIPNILKNFTVRLVDFFHFVTRIFTFWMPEISKPKTKRLPTIQLALWSFVLPFIIGLDDLIGYMGAMEVWNVMGILSGIYFADILIDILIFTSPKLTKKIVESDLLSFAATFAFLYLAYKSYHESILKLEEQLHISGPMMALEVALFILSVIAADLIMARLQKRDSYVRRVIGKRS